MDIKEELKRYKSEEIITHTSMSGGKYNIKNDKELYDILDKYEEHDITEKHLEEGSIIIIDIDIRLNKEKRIIDEIYIKRIIETINGYIEEIFNDVDKICYVMIREEPYKNNGKIKDGLHITYPNIYTSYEYIWLLREMMLIGLKWLEEISINKIEEIIDDNIIERNNWLLYGGNKPNIKGSPYKINKIYDNELNEIENKLNKRELIEKLSIRNKKEKVKVQYKIENNELQGDEEYEEIKKEYESKDKNKIRYMLMKILKEERSDKYNEWINIGLCLHNLDKNYIDLWEEFSKRSKKYKKGECNKIWKTFKENKNGLKIGSLYYYSKIDNKEMIKDLKIIDTLDRVKKEFPNNNLIIENIMRDTNYILVDLLDKYCPIFKKDHNINLGYIEMSPKGGIIMKCRCEECKGKIYPNDHEILINVSEQNNLFNITINNNIYNGVEQDIINSDVLIDNIKLHEDEEYNELLLDAINNIKPTKIARMLYNIYKNEFRYDMMCKSWYYFDNKWIKSNTKLRSNIKVIRKELKKTRTKIMQIEEEKVKKYLLKKLEYTIDELDNTSMKNNIIIESMEIFIEENENFDKLIDSNKYLIGFNNGVYDLIEMEFRKSKFDDYVSMSVNYDYISPNDDKYDIKKEERLIKFIEEIQPEKKQRDYLMTYLSTCLIGENNLQHFVILTGVGRNGKSKLNDLLSSTLGDYYSSVNSKFLTKSQPDANVPDPMVLDLIKKRLIISSEVDKKCKINTGQIKMITGADKIKARKCYSNEMIEYSIQYKTILLCNEIPKVDDPNDEAYWMRVKCINFPTQFVDKPMEKNQKKINYNLKIEELNIYFMLLLIEKYKNFKLNGLDAENITNDIKEKIMISNNVCLEYMINNTEYSTTHIHSSLLYNNFINWFRENNPTEKIPSNRQFFKDINSKYMIQDNVKMNNKNSSGIKNIKMKENEIDENEEIIQESNKIISNLDI